MMNQKGDKIKEREDRDGNMERDRDWWIKL